MIESPNKTNINPGYVSAVKDSFRSSPQSLSSSLSLLSRVFCNTSQLSPRIVQTAISSARGFLLWAPVDALVSVILSPLSSLLLDPRFSEPSVRCLSLFASRGMPPNDKLRVLSAIPFLQACEEASRRSLAPGASSEALDILVSTTSLVSCCGCQLDELTKPPASCSDAVTVCNQLGPLLLPLLAHSERRVSAAMFPFYAACNIQLTTSATTA